MNYATFEATRLKWYWFHYITVFTRHTPCIIFDVTTSPCSCETRRASSWTSHVYTAGKVARGFKNENARLCYKLSWILPRTKGKTLAQRCRRMWYGSIYTGQNWVQYLKSWSRGRSFLVECFIDFQSIWAPTSENDDFLITLCTKKKCMSNCLGISGLNAVDGNIEKARRVMSEWWSKHKFIY